MGHDDVYLYNNRIMKMKDVDKSLNKIGTWRENISLKAWILGICCFVGAAVFLLVKDKPESPKTQTNQTTEVKTPDNPVKTILYNATSNHTR